MAFTWKTNELSADIVSVYETNLTLNKPACRHFENVNYVLLGIDESSHSLGIKPVTKEAIEQSLYPRDQLYRISIGKSYGRVTNKAFINHIEPLAHIDFNVQSCYKFKASYDIIHDVLIVDYKGGSL